MGTGRTHLSLLRSGLLLRALRGALRVLVRGKLAGALALPVSFALLRIHLLRSLDDALGHRSDLLFGQAELLLGLALGLLGFGDLGLGALEIRELQLPAGLVFGGMLGE